MIPEESVQAILRHHLVDEWPAGTIAKQVGVHHSTVHRVLRQHGLTGAAKRRPAMVDPFLPFIEEQLAEFPKLPASRLYQMVRERGYPGQPDHFRSIVGRMRPKPHAEAFARLRTLPGEQAQADWAHFGKVQVGRNTLRPLLAFVMTLSWSRAMAVQFTFDQRLATFLHAHMHAFETFGGVSRTVIYDNLKAVVAERRGDAIRFNPTLLAFAAHYRYTPRPARPYRPTDKGRVERAIRYLRTSFFAGRPWTDLDTLNAEVAEWCTLIAAERRCPGDPTMSVAQAFAEERPSLRELPSDRFPAADRVEVRVGRTPYLRFDRNDYSVPHDHVRRTLTALVTPTTVRVLDGDDEVARHERSFEKGAQIEDPAHLEGLLAVKRQGRQSAGLDRLHHVVPRSQELLQGAAERGHNLGAAVAALLRLLDTWGAESLVAAVDEAVDADALHVAAVRQVLERRGRESNQAPPVAVELPEDPRVRNAAVRPHDLADYDDIGGET